MAAVRWVAKSMCPFKIVDNDRFQCMMKTGRPDLYIPSVQTVSRDVKNVFTQCQQQIARSLNVCGLISYDKTWNSDTYQDHDGALNFMTDAWMSPNHKAYVAATVHFQKDGVLVTMLLDLVEVTERHTGTHLAEVFAKILEDFRITDKVSVYYAEPTGVCLPYPRSSDHL